MLRLGRPIFMPPHSSLATHPESLVCSSRSYLVSAGRWLALIQYYQDLLGEGGSPRRCRGHHLLENHVQYRGQVDPRIAEIEHRCLEVR